MDAYPPEYLIHNLPLLVLSGLGPHVPHEEGTLSDSHGLLRPGVVVDSPVPAIEGEEAGLLLDEFLAADGRAAPWNAGGPSGGRTSSGHFRVRAVGRRFTFPARKANPPVFSPDILMAESPSPALPSPNWILHSPISPLSPGSPIFPDGVMTPLWLEKHESHVPAVFLSFFKLSSDPAGNAVNDNQLKDDIISIKTAIQRSEYKTRYAVVLLSDETLLHAPDVAERLGNIRRGTGLDPKQSLFFLPPTSSRKELTSFVHTVLQILQPICAEYYRDLTKHTRRKKGRGTIPPPTAPPTRGTSTTLSQQGWGVRYDFKLGIFAEYRQEMDAAARHYQSALDGLLGQDGIFETTAGWSPRWDEARLLADSIAFRLIRCMLWNKQPTSASQRWSDYRIRLRDVIDRRGKGSSNYGWQAWESRWAELMAGLVQRAEMSSFSVHKPDASNDATEVQVIAVFLQPEKGFPVGERLNPWHQLHHPGYWLALSAKHAIARRVMAEDIPEEDRVPPGQSPATQVATRYGTYDTYLVPEPHIEFPLQKRGGYDHCSDIVEKLNQAVGEFFSRGQQRKVNKMQYEMGRELCHAQRYSEAVGVLRPLWEGMSWRKERWWPLVSQVTWLLHDAAISSQDVECVLMTEFELLSKELAHRVGFKYDFMRCLDHPDLALNVDKRKPDISVRAVDVSSPITISFAFSQKEGNVGEPLQCQIVMSSDAQAGSAVLIISSLTMCFDGPLGNIVLSHDTDKASIENGHQLVTFKLSEQAAKPADGQSTEWSGCANMSLQPGQTKAFQFPIIFRDSGEVDATKSRLVIESSLFKFAMVFDLPKPSSNPVWWIGDHHTARPKHLARVTAGPVQILPKPPKMELRLPGFRERYYTDEEIALDVDILNEEDEDTEAVLEVRILGRSNSTLGFSWAAPDNESVVDATSIQKPDGCPDDLPGHPVGQLASGRKRTHKISVQAPSEPAEYTIEIKVLYHLLSERDIPIAKTLTAELVFVRPFEANYDFIPRVHPEPWPSFFQAEERLEATTESLSGGAALGIAQSWLLTPRIASFADEPVVITSTELVLQGVLGGGICSISKALPESPCEIKPQEIQERSFAIETRKISLDERRSLALELSLDVSWKRKGSQGAPTTSSLVVPRLLVPSSEPRVLASVRPSATVPGLIHLEYVLENPTMHLLTFELHMEASEDFAFGGSKLRGLNLLPLSRETVRYNVMPLIREGWVVPEFKVVDRYFNKVLKVVPTDGLPSDKKGVRIWIPEGS